MVMRPAVATMYPLPASKGDTDECWQGYAPTEA